MAENTILAFRCLNPECAQLIKLKRPARSGVYSIKCPHCQAEKKLRLKGMDAFGEEAPASAAQQGSPSARPAVPDNSTKAVKDLNEDFMVGVAYTFKCPHCESQEIGIKTDKAGRRTIACPRCKGKISFDVRAKTMHIVLSEQLQIYKGKLTLLRKGWLNKDFHLSEGKNIVGRYDESAMSDIAIKNDPAMSRRSVEIEVARTEKGYSFKFTVLKATNPVLHNGTPMASGDSVSLNFGDTIVMGKTRFRFDKDV